MPLKRRESLKGKNEMSPKRCKDEDEHAPCSDDLIKSLRHKQQGYKLDDKSHAKVTLSLPKTTNHVMMILRDFGVSCL